MKILQIITRLIHGGAQRVVVDTCAHLVRQGHEVHLAYGPVYGPEGSLLAAAQMSGAVLHEIGSMRRPILPWHDARCYFALRKLIGELTPDVVHTHSSKAGILGRVAAWSRRVPLVMHTVHGLPFHERQFRPLSWMYAALERYAAKRCHHLIAVSEAMVGAFVEKHIAPRDKFTVIRSGVDVERFGVDRSQGPAVRDTMGIPEGRRVVGIVARLDPLKGHHDLLDILPQLPGVHLLCIGDGWGRAAIERRIAEEGLADRVTLTGLVSPEQVARLLTCVEVNVLPSYQEGQGLTLAEALLAGCAVAGYDAGGIGSVCIDGQTGRLVPMGDKAQLRDAIRWLLDHPQEAALFTERGQRLVRDRFDIARMVEQIENLYVELMKQNAQGAEAQRRTEEKEF